jgi:hypothetical protein
VKHERGFVQLSCFMFSSLNLIVEPPARRQYNGHP